MKRNLTLKIKLARPESRSRHAIQRACMLCLYIAFYFFIQSCNTDTNRLSKNEVEHLRLNFLLSETELNYPVPISAFAPPVQSENPGSVFEGLLTLHQDQAQSGIAVIADEFSSASNAALKITELPPFQFAFVSDGNIVIPEKQTPQRSSHPYWEIVLSAGRAWPDPDDTRWSRVSLPFALKEKNQNCTHNGVMTFAFKSNGEVSRVAWQVSSETCLYLKINLWGMLPASYKPGVVSNREGIIARTRENVSARLETRPIGRIQLDYPMLDITGLVPDGVEDSSVYGFVIDGIHYRSDCRTRLGPYPFCDELILPSYSLAKSVFAGLLYLHVTRQWPEFASIGVSELVPECRLADGRWDGVSMSNLVNMTSGNYQSIEFGIDEAAVQMQKFFLAESHAGKIAFSCEAWPAKAKPGTTVVYHTTDDYILGTAMNAFIRKKLGPDMDSHRDFFYPRLLEPLALSPLMQWTQRTYDDAAQPFTAYGLLLRSDDLVRIVTSLMFADAGQKLLHQDGLAQAMFHQSNEPVLQFDGRDIAYQNGFWGKELSESLACANKTWIPFMSGYGGITVALMPNKTIYYNFSDSNLFRFKDAAIESNKIRDFCNP